MDKERRAFPRIKSRLMTFIKDVKTGKVQRVITKDLSGGGLSFVTEGLMEPRADLEVEMKLPDRDETLRFMARVVWSRVTEEAKKTIEEPTTETGLTFVSIDPKIRSEIIQYATINAPPSG